MIAELGTLNSGQTYEKGKYRVISNNGYIIRVIRLADKWRICFHCSQENFKHKVTKDN